MCSPFGQGVDDAKIPSVPPVVGGVEGVSAAGVDSRAASPEQRISPREQEASRLWSCSSWKSRLIHGLQHASAAIRTSRRPRLGLPSSVCSSAEGIGCAVVPLFFAISGFPFFLQIGAEILAVRGETWPPLSQPGSSLPDLVRFPAPHLSSPGEVALDGVPLQRPVRPDHALGDMD